MADEIVKHSDTTFADMQRIGSALAASGYFDTAKEHKIAVAQMVTKIMAGAEMGFPPFASVQGVNIIKGRPTLSANLMAAAVKAHPRYNYRVREMSDERVLIEFFEGSESLGKSEFTKEDLERAESGTLVAPGAKKSMAQRFPRNMLFARAMSNGVRWYTPDLFAGNAVYTPDELDADAEGEYTVVDELPDEPLSFDDSPPQRNGAAPNRESTPHTRMWGSGQAVFGSEWDEARAWLIRRWTNTNTPDSVRDSAKDLTDDEKQAIHEALQQYGTKLQEQWAAHLEKQIAEQELT